MQTQRNILFNLFGPYVSNTRIVPGLQEYDKQEVKRREEELFEAIEDYIEQA